MPPFQEVALRLIAAALLGGLVGIERELRERSAGLRTHALVSTGSALFMLISAYGFGGREDPARLAAQVVSGIGFLGAGTIIFRKDAVRGLTTAASVWTVAGVGLACGLGQYALAGACVVVTLVILAGIAPLERLMGTKHRPVLRLKFDPARASLTELIEAVSEAGGRLNQLTLRHEDEHDRVEIALEGSAMPNASVLENLRGIPGVIEVRCGLESGASSDGEQDSEQPRHDTEGRRYGN